jgi:hypothetical protein
VARIVRRLGHADITILTGNSDALFSITVGTTSRIQGTNQLQTHVIVMASGKVRGFKTGSFNLPSIGQGTIVGGNIDTLVVIAELATTGLFTADDFIANVIGTVTSPEEVFFKAIIVLLGQRTNRQILESGDNTIFRPGIQATRSIRSTDSGFTVRIATTGL